MVSEQRVPCDPGEMPVLPIRGAGPRFSWTNMTVQEATTETNLLNLLIVDDERVVREGCRDVAQALGFSTYTAENAEQAYKIIDSTSVDVILLDLRLPGI